MKKIHAAANERKGRITMDDLRAFKLKKNEQAIQEWLDLSKEMGMSRDEIAAEFQRMVEDVNAGRIRS